VTLFDAADQIGGQFNIAKQIPGKEEFHETLRYFRRQLALREVTVRLGVKVEAADLKRIRRSDPRLRHRAAHPGHPRHRPRQGAELSGRAAR
jgi:NADPH-dependent 2,4-dienoyl-CoA reductase/sulfur reductase-like enzyme